MRYRKAVRSRGCEKCHVSQSCGKWYISIQTESEVSTPVHPSASMVGLDAGWLNSPRCQMAQSLSL
ncbi:putative transposase family protein [Escherichia coli 3-020-07_S4_C2]|nr:putative transposase family protein [Escherichia coli 3-020-07_S4_C2]